MRLAALASMSLFASASGDYVSMFVERGNVPAFPGTTTYRIFATFDDPGDKVIALAGLPPAFPLEFSTTGGSLIQDDFGLGCSLDSLLRNGLTGPADSFITIRSVDSFAPFPAIGDPIGPAENPDVGFTPGVLCNATPQVTIQGSSWSTGDEAGGLISNNPSGDEETGQAVLLAQFTLPEGDDFTFSGTVNYTLAGDTDALIAFFSIDTSTLPVAAECDTVDEFLVILNSGTATDCNLNNVLDLCEAGDLNANGLADNCECIADVNGDERVDLEDIVTLLFSWGEPASGLAVNVDATTAGSENVIDQADLDAVMDAALGTGCAPEISPFQAAALAQPQETRESSSPESTSEGPLALDLPLPLEITSIPSDEAEGKRPSGTEATPKPRTGQQLAGGPILSNSDSNQDALENLLEIISFDATQQTSDRQLDWDLDRDGLLDPWSVMILPLSSWPEELRPFAKLLRP